MDGFQEHLSNIYSDATKQRLECEEYDTDAVFLDIPAVTNPDLSQSNIAKWTHASQRESMSEFIYSTKCMPT